MTSNRRNASYGSPPRSGVRVQRGGSPPPKRTDTKSAEKRAVQEFHRTVGRPPWFTSRGLDVTKLPIDNFLKRALSEDEEDFHGALSILRAMQQAGRQDAGVFLLGLLAHTGEDWGRRIQIVESLKGFDTEGCADFLVAELRKVKASNTTRRYLASILTVLQQMPIEMAQPRLLALMADGDFSQKMQNRFAEALDQATRRAPPLG